MVLCCCVVPAVSGTAKGECTLDIDVKNANDPPAWNINTVFDLAIPERSIAGAPVKLKCDSFASNNECDTVGTVAPNANFDLVTDPDAGQDVFFDVVRTICLTCRYLTHLILISFDFFLFSLRSPRSNPPVVNTRQTRAATC